MEHLLKIEGLDVSFNGTAHALRGIDLAMDTGQIHGLVGESGSGKSTLLRCINHLETPTSGDVWVDGIHLSKKTKDINRQ